MCLWKNLHQIVTSFCSGGQGPMHYGVCSNYLQDVSIGDNMYIFVRKCVPRTCRCKPNLPCVCRFSAPSFYLPSDETKPIILVGPGTGIAPFRAFWQERLAMIKDNVKLGKCWLFFGCRQKELDLYREEKEDMCKNKAIDRIFLALSREPNVTKVSAMFGWNDRNRD